ncbi:MAG: gamma-glutamyltransferase [Chloroflexi bacterium]|nr:gamma-glutamyltransferase [Chloroflexota bacterium]
MKTMSFDFKSRRSMISARRGMVGASSPLAAQAGLNILRQGGNAADAAVATSAMMNVMDPGSCGVGGDCFALFFDATTKEVTALNGSGRAPQALTLDAARALGWEKMNPSHAHSVTVPGAVRGWHDLLQRHGSMTLAEVLEDAIHYADEGFPLAPVVGYRWERSGAFLRNAANAEEYLPNGETPKAGQVIRLPGLANTLRMIAEGGPDAFYSGPVADAIVTSLGEQGGLMSLDDLKNHHSTWDEPISTDYRRVTVLECPPNGQGLTALIALNIAEHFDLASLPWYSPERIHLMVECMRLAWADAHEYIADMSQADVPLEGLLSVDYAAERAARIQPYYAIDPPPSPGELPGGSDTIYLSVVDGEGNACSFIKSLYMGFGVGIVAEGTGVWLQNRGAGFSLIPGHRNCLAPGKRPYHTIIPGMALKDGALWASFGVMGGFMQPQGHFQVISALVDDDLNPQEALNRPRWYVDRGDPGGNLLIEEGTPFKTMADLAERGHRIQPESGLGRGNFGRGQVIRYDAETGVMHGGSEPRADGQIAAF